MLYPLFVTGEVSPLETCFMVMSIRTAQFQRSVTFLKATGIIDN